MIGILRGAMKLLGPVRSSIPQGVATSVLTEVQGLGNIQA